MHLSTQTMPFDDPLEDVLPYLADLGFEGIDLKCTGRGPAELAPGEYLDDPDAQRDLLDLVDAHGLQIDVLGAGGTNPLHPDPDTAAAADRMLREVIELADQLGVDTVTAFAGLPGGGPEDRTPNWITAMPPFPELAEAYAYQWDEVAIPYWRDLAAFADDHGVDVAIELHINTIASSPDELLRLRRETNDRVGAYVDPGHLVLQRIDPVRAVRDLAAADANLHFEASDVRFARDQLASKGTTDMTSMRDGVDRAWNFCTVGYGELTENDWRQLVAELHLVGYDGAVSIQHLNTPEPFRAGLERAADYLGGMLF